MSVSTLKLSATDRYEVKRNYGGQLRHQRQSRLGFETPGTISQVHVQEGDQVDAGDLLVTLDQAAIQAELKGALSEVESARARVTAQRAQLELSEATLERNQTLAENGHVSYQLLDELAQQTAIQKANLNVTETTLISASARADQVAVKLRKSALLAPYAARIQARHLDEGSIVSPGEAVIQLVETGKLEAHIGFPESMVGSLTLGESYEFTVNNQQVPGRLKAILPSVDIVSGTVMTQFLLDADNLFGGSLAELNLSVEVFEAGFWVPISALAESQRGLWSVLVVTDLTGSTGATNNTVEARLVEILHRGNNAVYVRGMLEDGDLIVDSGTGRIVPGQNVRVADRSTIFKPNGS